MNVEAEPAPGTPPRINDLSAAGRVRLLDMTRSRLFYSVSMTPLAGVPYTVWFYLLNRDIAWMGLLLAIYCLAALALFVLARRYRRDRCQYAALALLEKWIPIVNRIAVLHGLGLAAMLTLTAGRVSFEYTAVLHASIAGTMAANAAHQTPLWGVFQRFFLTCWLFLLILVPWSFPQHWPYVLPMAVLFAVALYRHGVTSHRFFVQQVNLEEQGARLAERYRMARDEAQRALQDKNQFLSTASHDLRQPVHAMGFLIQAIAQRNRDETLAAPIRDLQQSVRSMNLMFNSLLDLSKLEAGVVNPQREPVRLKAIVEDVVAMFRAEANSRGLELRMRLATTSAVAFGDAGLIRRCLVNLVHNALRYTPRGGVLVSARRRGPDWMLEVWDTGIGVASDEQKNIYALFYRNAHAWNIDSAGHGLGLAVVARSANLMGARYGLDSVPGRGSRFWLSLPAAARLHGAAGLAAAGGGTAAEIRLAPLTGACLVVDDDPMVTQAWQSLMRAWGVSVRCVAGGDEAFALLRGGFRPRAILCDQRLRSGESGFQVLQALLEACPHASGAMVSGEFRSPTLEHAEREGYLVLQKPLQPAQLHAVLCQWLAAGDQPAPLP
ncbi:hybrid sensor histidine kinase/response regulator [Alloalcanivorax mobilis]|uniref:hybrid sensor histidine kinase/response regulator n=1 Tax=Alloalcanivorax mobilis TaxID=2019569 RepID=UPI001E5D844F|nr:hybrid sensor histidine kinase/response regulator [Alloalcanivorax mobilis]